MLWSWSLFILYGGLGIANVARGLLALSLRQVLRETSLSFGVLGWIYAAWGVAFLICAVIVVWPRDRARWLLSGCAVAYQVTGWTLRVLGDVSTYARRIWLRDALVSVLFLAVAFLLNYLDARRVRPPLH